MSREKEIVPAYATIQFTYWQVKTADASLFKVGRHDFEQILIVMGEKLSYYMYYVNDPRRKMLIYGHTATPLTYCSCCLNMQYKNIIKVIGKHALK